MLTVSLPGVLPLAEREKRYPPEKHCLEPPGLALSHRGHVTDEKSATSTTFKAAARPAVV